jgi:hypothetical protein
MKFSELKSGDRIAVINPDGSLMPTYCGPIRRFGATHISVDGKEYSRTFGRTDDSQYQLKLVTAEEWNKILKDNQDTAQKKAEAELKQRQQFHADAEAWYETLTPLQKQYVDEMAEPVYS